jgi:hypothetical protein
LARCTIAANNIYTFSNISSKTNASSEDTFSARENVRIDRLFNLLEFNMYIYWCSTFVGSLQFANTLIKELD